MMTFGTKSLTFTTNVSRLVSFPHAGCTDITSTAGKGMKYENISKLITQLQSTFSEQGYVIYTL